jgi:hypothetical protein
MNENQFELLKKTSEQEKRVYLKELTNKKDHTLLYGYTCERETFHVYIRHGEIHKIIFDSNSHKPRVHEHGDSLSLHGIVPDKRLYPEACDFEFCELLMKMGVSLPFTTWDEKREEKTFHSHVAQPSGNLSAWQSMK